MKKVSKTVICLLLGAFFITVLALAQEDKEGCMDHPLFTRLSGYYLRNCEEMEFDTHKFYDPATKKKVSVEGRKYTYSYYIKNELRGKKSQLQVARNYTNAITKIGGSFYDISGNSSRVDMKAVKGDKEIWVSVDQDNWKGNTYYLTIVEKETMVQELIADPEAMAGDISTTGHVAVYGIYFDLDSYTIKPQSEPALKAIADMLKANSSLKVYIVGHTDMTGTFEHNMELSGKRAEAVVNEMVNKYGIVSGRLKAKGVGPLCPVSTNKTEEGRELNRRVDLVEM